MVCQETATTNYDLGSVIGYQEISQGNLNITFTQGTPVSKVIPVFHVKSDVHYSVVTAIVEALLHYYHAHLMLPVASLVLSMALITLSPQRATTLS